MNTDWSCELIDWLGINNQTVLLCRIVVKVRRQIRDKHQHVKQCSYQYHSVSLWATVKSREVRKRTRSTYSREGGGGWKMKRRPKYHYLRIHVYGFTGTTPRPWCGNRKEEALTVYTHTDNTHSHAHTETHSAASGPSAFCELSGLEVQEIWKKQLFF